MANASRSLALLALILGFGVSQAAVAAPLGPVEADRVRLRQHFREVEQELLSADVSKLSPEQKRERQKNIERLRRYARAGVFPHNTGFPDKRVPFFIDRDGRACAVGALMIESGAKKLAEQISKNENNARVPDIKTSGLAQWVGKSGLTVEECTRIQPTYCDESLCDAGAAPVCGKSGTSYWCKAVLEKCSNDEYAYDGECLDGGTLDGGTPDGGTPDGGRPVVAQDDGGCAVSESGGGGSTNGAWAALAVVMAILSRRRRQPSVPRRANQES